jgi:ubiquitin carboxyl-terminal hydrolase 10
MFEAASQVVTSGVVACGKCGHQSRTKGNEDSSFSVAISPKIPQGSVSQYLHKYINETVEGYRCDRCKELSNAKKSQEISHGPEILVVQLKRFDHDRRKDKSPVVIDHTLNLNQYRTANNKQSLKYELKAVIKHSGNSNFGHYICSAVGPDDRWYAFDDQKKTVSTPEAATNGKSSFTPYILYYQRKRKVATTQPSFPS